VLQSRQVQISSKPHRGKGIGPTYGFTASPEVGPGATVGTLQTGYPCVQDLSLVPQHQTLHPVGKGSSVTACPCGSRHAPGAEELWHRHVPHGTGHATPLERALVSSRVPRLQTYSRCGRALASPCADRPTDRQGRASVSPRVLCLQTRFGCGRALALPCGVGPTTRQRRALVSPHVPRLQTHLSVREGSGVAMCPMTLRRARAFSRRLLSGSSWPHQARRAGSALNAYRTSHTWCMASIKCIKDIDTTGRR
jgi:hypothetical protein